MAVHIDPGEITKRLPQLSGIGARQKIDKWFVERSSGKKRYMLTGLQVQDQNPRTVISRYLPKIRNSNSPDSLFDHCDVSDRRSIAKF